MIAWTNADPQEYPPTRELFSWLIVGIVLALLVVIFLPDVPGAAEELEFYRGDAIAGHARTVACADTVPHIDDPVDPRDATARLSLAQQHAGIK